jgi:hypothetical protein
MACPLSWRVIKDIAGLFISLKTIRINKNIGIIESGIINIIVKFKKDTNKVTG